MALSHLRRKSDYCVQTDQNLSILAGPWPHTARSKPTWAPYLQPNGILDCWLDQHTWNVSSKLNPEVAFLSDELLAISGQDMDTISKVYGPFVSESHSDDSPKAIQQRDFPRALLDVFLLLTEEQKNIFWRVLIVDSFASDRPGCRDLRFTSPAPDHLEGMFGLFLKGLKRYGRLDAPYALATSATLNLCCIIILVSGRLGIAPHDSEPGDKVIILHGGNPFYVLRQEEDHDLFIGDAYVYGGMAGEFMSDDPKDNTTFVLH